LYWRGNGNFGFGKKKSQGNLKGRGVPLGGGKKLKIQQGLRREPGPRNYYRESKNLHTPQRSKKKKMGGGKTGMHKRKGRSLKKKGSVCPKGRIIPQRKELHGNLGYRKSKEKRPRMERGRHLSEKSKGVSIDKDYSREKKESWISSRRGRIEGEVTTSCPK